MARRRPEHPPVHRTDLLPSNLTAAKQAKLLDLLSHYRAGAVLLGREQWRLFFEVGGFDKQHDVDKVGFAAVIGAANRVQMCRYQVVGQLKGWISNRCNDFRDVVQRSGLPPETKHALHVINRTSAWFRRGEVAVKGVTVPADVRALARSIMRRVMGRHRRPDLSRISMRLDQRGACLAKPVKAKQAGRVGWWVSLSTMTARERIAIPLLTYDYHRNRPGRVTNGLQVNRSRDGVLSFGVVTDMGEVCAQSRATYDGEGAIALDFGLSTMFATSEGQMLGQGWLARLRRYDGLLAMIAAAQQRAGRKPRDSRRYRSLVEAVRGFIRSEVGRVLNRLVQQGRPKELVLERLDFRNPALSRRLNRVIQNCGRSVIQSKLVDLEQRLGVISTEVNPAYSSQTCSRPGCGYVDKRNRPSQGTFRCLWCGHKTHADLNAAPNIGERRALPIGSVFQSKAAVLAEVVRAFGERRVRSLRPGRTGDRGAPADPRLTNPYFGMERTVVVRSSRRRKASKNDGSTPALVAA